MALGGDATVIDPGNGSVSTGSGTSYSSPITAGMMACLWQSNPAKTNMEILDAARMSANYYDNPNENMGYGIPDYAVAMDMIISVDTESIANENSFVYPNPFTKRLVFAIDDTSATIEVVNIYDFQGRKVYSETVGQKIPNYGKFAIEDLSSLKPGNYILQIVSNKKVYEKKITKF